MLFRFTVMMCVSIAVVGGKLRFLTGRPRDLRHCIFHRSFCFVGANYCDLFFDSNSFGSLGEVSAHGGEFHLSFLIVVGLGHGDENYMAGPSHGAYEQHSSVAIISVELISVYRRAIAASSVIYYR